MLLAKIVLMFWCLFWVILNFKGSDCFNLDNVVYVSRAHGQSKDDCGSKALPCKALQVGIDKLAWGGLLYIDGDQTTTDPYSCESSAGRVVAKKSLRVQSSNAMAEISCPNGFTISADNGSIGLDVTITGVQFDNTVLFLRNVRNVVIQDCIFVGSSPAIEVIISKGSPSVSYSLRIKRTIFKRNRGCVYFECQFDNKNNIVNRAILELSNVTFEENIAARDQTNVKGGLVFVNLSHCNCLSIAFESIWENVIAIRNSFRNKTIDIPKRFFRAKGIGQDAILNSTYVLYTRNASLKFSQIRSEYNSGLRFLGLRSRHCSVRIYESCFHGHVVRGPGGVIYIPDGHLIDVGISDSDFTKNVGTVGGVIHIDGGDSKTAILTLSNVNIRQCYGAITGCAISLGETDPEIGIAKVLFFLNGVLFQRCDARNWFLKAPYGPLCLVTIRSSDVGIRNSVFDSNKNYNSMAYIKHTAENYNDSTVKIEITNCLFQDNQRFIRRKDIIQLVVTNHNMIKRSRLLVSDSVFTFNSGNVLNVFNVQEVKIHNFTCKHTSFGACYSFLKERNYGKKFPHGSQMNLVIEKSKFLHNIKSIYIKFEESSFVNIEVRDTIIKDNVNFEQVYLVLGDAFPSMIKRSFIGQVLFERVSFISNKNYGLFRIFVPWIHDGNISFVFHQSVFKDNLYRGYYGSLIENPLFLFQSPRDSAPGDSSFCKKPLHSSCIYRTIFIFNKVIFENNIGSSFIVHIANGKTLFKKCLFKNNYSKRPRTGGHLFIEQGTASVDFQNTTFIQTQVKTNYSVLFVFAGGSGPLIFRNSNFVSVDSSERVNEQLTIQSEGYVHFDKMTELLCPLGSYVEIENGSQLLDQNPNRLNITRLKFTCSMCAVGRYTMERGSYKGGLSSTKCIEFCPFGAECSWNIQSRPNFWGYYTSTDPPQLNFTRCHEKYCHVPKSSYTNTSVYNACYGNRTGVMCGACKEGFTESMFNHKCRPNEECRDVWFWVIAGLYSIIMACYFLYRPPVLLYLVKNLLWFRKKKPSTQNGTLDDDEEESNEHGGHGYSKIIFYFYQVADLLMLESASEILHSYNLIFSVISFYSFQIELADSKLGCPFPGLTAVTKELFRSAQVFAVMGFVLVFYFLHWLLRLFRTKSRPDMAPYLAAIVEVLLLGYERLGHTSLMLLNCVPIKVRGVVEWRLVLDGTVACWSHWWQYCLIAYNVIFVLPFLLVLLMGTSRLRSQRITAVQFVAACFVPLPFVAYWLIMMCFTRRESDEAHDITTAGIIPDNPGSEALLEVLQGPFKPPDHQSRGASYWESVLIGRRLIFLCLFSFVSTPMLRMLFMTTVCFAIPFHNVIINPYKDRRTNAFGIIMLFIHVVLAIINLCKSVFITIGVTAEGPTRSQIDGLQFFEVALLGFLPCVFVILVVATLVSQVYRLLVLILRIIRRCIMYIKRRSRIDSCDDIHRALTSPTEEDNILYDDIIDSTPYT